jgi:predicted GNAT family N-acyltransferase
MDGVRLRSGDWSELAEQCRAVRDQVFVLEQGVPVELEHDALDPQCLHVLAFQANGEGIATGRLLPDGHLGRMAVRKEWRGLGVGGAILALLLEEARERSHPKVMLNAQLSAIGFYRSFGFLEVGSPFVEAGIDHQAMVLTL